MKESSKRYINTACNTDLNIISFIPKVCDAIEQIRSQYGCFSFLFSLDYGLLVPWMWMLCIWILSVRWVTFLKKLFYRPAVSGYLWLLGVFQKNLLWCISRAGNSQKLLNYIPGTRREAFEIHLNMKSAAVNDTSARPIIRLMIWFWNLHISVRSSARPSLGIVCWTVEFCVLTVWFFLRTHVCVWIISVWLQMKNALERGNNRCFALFSFPPASFCWCGIKSLASVVKHMTDKSIRKHSRVFKHCKSCSTAHSGLDSDGRTLIALVFMWLFSTWSLSLDEDIDFRSILRWRFLSRIW